MDLENGLQVFVGNLYLTCPQPKLAMGMPPHSDHGLLSLVTQNGIGGFQLQQNGMWVNANSNAIPNSFLVKIADQLEVQHFSFIVLIFNVPGFFFFFLFYNHFVDLRYSCFFFEVLRIFWSF